VGEGLHARLRDGFNVLVHCKGDLGRAGTIAGRLLIGLGMAPLMAVGVARQARPGAIETSGQERYVMALREVPGAVPDPAATTRRLARFSLGRRDRDDAGVHHT
jgi:ADP-ribosyl-[dinitrogen reductase] hydrolase